MQRRIAVLVAAMLVPTVAVAQRGPGVEVGTSLGVSVANSNGSTLTHIGLPGEGLLGQPALYAAFFPGGRWLVRPQLALNRISGDGDAATTVGLGSELGYLFSGARKNSVYVAATGGFQTVSVSGDSESDFGAGARVGYRLLVGESVGVRLESGYRRWFDSELNEFSVGIGVGGIIRGL